MAAQAPLLQLKQLQLNYDKTQVLSDINFTMHKGELVALVGPNGSGKTSLLNCINGFVPRNHGDIELAAKNMSHYSASALAKIVASVSQHQQPSINLPLLEYVSLGLLPHLGLWQKPSQAQQQLIKQTLSDFDLNKQSSTPISQLSGGQRQRAHIVKALLQQPQLLLLDEPNNHLDIEHQLGLLSFLKQQSFSTLVSLHDLNLAAQYCDRIIMLDKGRIVAIGSPEHVLTQDNIEQVFKVQAQIKNHHQNGLVIEYRYQGQSCE